MRTHFGRAAVLVDVVVKAGKIEFTFEDLVVAAWNEKPWLFGLKGFERDYPDSNKVSVALHDRHGPIKRGILERPARGRLRLVKQ